MGHRSHSLPARTAHLLVRIPQFFVLLARVPSSDWLGVVHVIALDLFLALSCVLITITLDVIELTPRARRVYRNHHIQLHP
jgi:hypothetical protein